MRIRVNQDVLPEYLSIFLNSELCRPQIDRAATGSSRLALDYTSIKELKILLPTSKVEQAKIVKTVVDKLAQVNKLRAQLEQIETQMLQVMD